MIELRPELARTPSMLVVVDRLAPREMVPISGR